jgi:ketosteroid isomerase-like protein
MQRPRPPKQRKEFAVAHPNEARFREGYELFGKGDLETLRRDFFTEDTVWHTAGNNALTGDAVGIDAVMENFMKTFQLSGGSFKTEIHDVLANDDHGVVIGNASAERDGKMYEWKYTHVVHFKDGKVSESWVMTDEPNQPDAVFA